jgi:Mce-associated membrane protein
VTAAARGGRRLVTVLFVVALVLACACVAGGVLVLEQARDGDGTGSAAARPTAEEQDRYGEVTRAAEATATALVNIDYRDPQKSFDAVAATATGTFLDQYQASADSLVKLVTSFRSVLTGTVAVSAVDDIDADSASVLVATDGKVSNAQTGETTQVRNFRLLVELVRQDGVWLANDLQFVG